MLLTTVLVIVVGTNFYWKSEVDRALKLYKVAFMNQTNTLVANLTEKFRDNIPVNYFNKSEINDAFKKTEV